MAASGRESYAVGAQRLEQYAVRASAQRLAEVADEMLAVARVLTRQLRLRRLLADTARTAEDRAGLLRSVFAGKVGDDALDLVAALVAGRWSAPSELLDAVERLAVQALMAAAERDGYLADVEDELFRFGQVVSGDRELAAALSDSTTPVERRAALVRDLLGSRARPVTTRLAELAVTGFGGRGFAPSLARLVEYAAAQRDRTVAYVTAAVLPTEAEEQRLVDALSRMYRRGISLKIQVDPGVIGGMSVRVGSDLYDGTVLRRLTEVRQALSR
jgi:F-type H+-transporting ATPase subunit delta